MMDHFPVSEAFIQRPTIAEINLSHLAYNLAQIKQRVQPSKIMAIVKANAYGHGLVHVARHLARQGVDQLGVAFLEEGVALRRAGLTLPILVMGGLYSGQIGYFLDFDLELTVSSLDKLRQVEAIAEAKGRDAIIHLKIDTGMERVGVHSYSARPLVEAAIRSRHCHLKGIYSHLACSDDPSHPMTLHQLERFAEVTAIFDQLGVARPLRHIANSGAILHFPEAFLDMVRPGILLYGVYPDPASQPLIEVRPVLSLRSTVVYFKVVEAHHSVSYGASWQTDHPVRVVTIPIGYGDGYRRAFSNRGTVLIRGKRYPIIGRVCMDQFMVNLEQGTAYNGDDVILIGSQGEEMIRVEELAQLAETIPYEILTGLNERIPRVYLGEREI